MSALRLPLPSWSSDVAPRLLVWTLVAALALFFARVYFDDGLPSPRVRPRSAVDDRLAGRIQRGPMAEQARVRPCGDRATTRVLGMHHAVTGDTVLVQAGTFQPLARHRFHRVPPDLRKYHGPAILVLQIPTVEGRFGNSRLAHCLRADRRCGGSSLPTP